ncbi:MAG: hypothetical protein AAGE80_04285 [Pseudomonadota bacterium]
MLTKLTLVSVSILGAAGLALAGTADTFTVIDANSDAQITLGEFQQAYPELDPEIFAQLDRDQDNLLSPSEFIGSNLPEVEPSEG